MLVKNQWVTEEGGGREEGRKDTLPPIVLLEPESDPVSGSRCPFAGRTAA